MGDLDVADEAAGDRLRTDLKQEVLAVRGYWHEWHQALLDLSPSYLRAYLDFHEPPFIAGNVGRKMCEFVYIAVDAAVSHLFTPGVEMHVRKALEIGASPAEVMEVIQLAMLAAYSPHTTGLPILADEVARSGMAETASGRELTEAEEAAKAGFVEITGFWPEGGDELFRFAPGFARGFLSYAEIPYREGPLALKDKELILISVFASPVAPQPQPLRLHIRRALARGASPEEIADVLQLSSAIAIHTCVAAAPALADAMRANRPVPGTGTRS